MDISGKIIAVLPLQSGVSKAGRDWKKQEYVLETQDTYPRKVKFDFFGDKVDQYPLGIGDMVTVSFDIESREFNGRWYTDIHGWKAEKGGMTQPQSVQAAAPQFGPQSAPLADNFGAPAADASDDLPF